MTTLKKILQFNNVAAGGTATAAHSINVNGVALKPDLIFLSDGNFTATATTTDVSVTNNSAGILSVTVYCECWHDIERQFGTRFNDPFVNSYRSSIIWQCPTPTVPEEALTPQPFVFAGGGGGGGLPVFTPGSVIFADPLGALDEDSANFFWDIGNHYLGIGTVSPGSQIHCMRTGLTTTQSPSISVENSTPSTALAPTQYSPGIQYIGRAWSTGAGGSDQQTSTFMYETPLTDVTAQGVFNISKRRGGGALTKVVEIGDGQGSSPWNVRIWASIGTTEVFNMGNEGRIVYSPPAVFAAPAGVERIDYHFNLNRIVQFATGPLSLQRGVVFSAPTYAFVGGSVITSAATVFVDGQPIIGLNGTVTNNHGMWLSANGSTGEMDIHLGGGVTRNVSGYGSVTLLYKESYGGRMILTPDNEDTEGAGCIEWFASGIVPAAPSDSPSGGKGSGFLFMRSNGLASPNEKTELCVKWEDGSITAIAAGPAS